MSFVCVHIVSATNFNKDVTYQCRGIRIRKISKENEDAGENNKQKHSIASGESSNEYLKSPAV